MPEEHLVKKNEISRPVHIISSQSWVQPTLRTRAPFAPLKAQTSSAIYIFLTSFIPNKICMPELRIVAHTSQNIAWFHTTEQMFAFAFLVFCISVTHCNYCNFLIALSSSLSRSWRNQDKAPICICTLPLQVNSNARGANRNHWFRKLPPSFFFFCLLQVGC